MTQRRTVRRSIVVFAALLVAGVLQIPAIAGAAAPPDLTYYGGNGYVLVETQYEDWDDAAAAAAAMPTRGCAGVHLATITSTGEQSVLSGLMAGSDRNAWLGGFQPPGELSLAAGWQWMAGETWAYTNWAFGEPNDNPYGTFIAGSEQYLEAYQGSGLWNDAPKIDAGDGAKYFVAEFEDCPNAHPAPLDVTIVATELIAGPGTFVATGPAVDYGIMCATGTTFDTSLTANPAKKHTNLKVEKLFTCDDLSGDFLVRLKVKLFPDGTTTASWNVLSGTGAYATLIGSGQLVGTPIVPGLSIEDVYTGKMKI